MPLVVHFFPPFIPLCPVPPMPPVFPNPSFMSMGYAYNFFGFSISYTILNIPLFILCLPIVLLIPCTFLPFSPYPLPTDNPPCDLHFCDSVPVLVVCLVSFLFVCLGLVVVSSEFVVILLFTFLIIFFF